MNPIYLTILCTITVLCIIILFLFLADFVSKVFDTKRSVDESLRISYNLKDRVDELERLLIKKVIK